MAKVQKQKSTPAATGTQQSWFATTRKPALLLGIIAFLVYANTLKNGYALDDFIAIQNNSIVSKGISAIPELFCTPYHWGDFAAGNDLYRPLSLALFAIEHQLSDSAALGHFINVLLFSGCVILLFSFLVKLFGKDKSPVAFIATLLFALHPIHTEVVANIKSSDELLCFFFAFLSLHTFMNYVASGKNKQLIAASAYLFLSLLSKETSISFIAIIPLVFFAYRNEHRQRSKLIMSGAALAFIAYLSIRFAVLYTHHGNGPATSFIDNPLVQAPSYISVLATAFGVLGSYIKLLLLPYPLICDYSYNSIPTVGFGNAWTLVSLFLYTGLAVTGIYLFVKNRKDPFAFGILFFLITIALFSNIPFLIGAEMAERFVFFASAGFCWCVALAIDKWGGKGAPAGEKLFKNTTVAAIVVVICLAYSGMTIARNSDWQDNNTLYSADTKKAPNNCRLFYSLGTDRIIAVSETSNTSEQAQLINEGIGNLKKALAIYPQFAMAASELGHEYFITAQYDSAEVYNKLAIALDPADTNARNNLTGAYFYEKKYTQALDECRQTTALFPKYARAYLNMGICQQYMNNYDSAIWYFRKTQEVNPGNTAVYKHFAKVYRLMGVMDSANKYEAIAQQYR